MTRETTIRGVFPPLKVNPPSIIIKGLATALFCVVIGTASLAVAEEEGVTGELLTEDPVAAEAPVIEIPAEVPAAVEAYVVETPLIDPPHIGEFFDGEVRHYAMSFWVLEDIAFATLTLESVGDGTYLAVLEAQTTGVIGWITRYRRDTYREVMEVVEGGTRFRTVTFDKFVDLAGKTKGSHTDVDYAASRMEWKMWKKGELVEEDGIDMEEDVYYDGPLTGFFNFRYGVYGSIEEGRSYQVRTFPKSRGKRVDILIRISTRGEFDKRFPERGDFAGYLADVNLDKELFDSKSGDVDLIFADDMALVEGVAKDIVLFGDVRSRLVDEDGLAKIRR